MKLEIDERANRLVVETDADRQSLDLYSDEAFALLSHLWLKVGWNQKYTYSFSWFGRPVIQLPEDLIRVQEVIYHQRPDVIVETGIAHGGSLVFYASLQKALGKGRVVGVDILIRPQNRRAIEEHDLSPLITLIEGNSTDETVVSAVRSQIRLGETVLVVLDSRHDRDHVLAELEVYAPLVTPGSYVIATDGIMRYLDDVPRGRSEWSWNNPAEAALEYARRHPAFVIEQPPWTFNESTLESNLTHWPGGWLRRA